MVRVTILLTETFLDFLPVLTITEMNLKIRERGTWTGGINLKAASFGQVCPKRSIEIEPYHHGTVVTSDSPVCGLIRPNFSQDDIKLVSRVFGTQQLCRPFQPLGCCSGLCKNRTRLQSKDPIRAGQWQEDIPLCPCYGERSAARKASRCRSRTVRVSHE